MNDGPDCPIGLGKKGNPKKEYISLPYTGVKREVMGEIYDLVKESWLDDHSIPDIQVIEGKPDSSPRYGCFGPFEGGCEGCKMLKEGFFDDIDLTKVAKSSRMIDSYLPPWERSIVNFRPKVEGFHRFTGFPSQTTTIIRKDGSYFLVLPPEKDGKEIKIHHNDTIHKVLTGVVYSPQKNERTDEKYIERLNESGEYEVEIWAGKESPEEAFATGPD